MINVAGIVVRDDKLVAEELILFSGLLNIDFAAEADIPEDTVDNGFNVSHGSKIKPINYILVIFMSEEYATNPTKTFAYDVEYEFIPQTSFLDQGPGSPDAFFNLLVSLRGRCIDIIYNDGRADKYRAIASVSTSRNNLEAYEITASVRQVMMSSIETGKLTRRVSRRKAGVGSGDGKFNMVEDTEGATEILADNDTFLSDILQSGINNPVTSPVVF
jgi:hypothetical protein